MVGRWSFGTRCRKSPRFASRWRGTEVFRGYRALPVAFSGYSRSCGGDSAVILRDPAQQIMAYLGLWTGAAALVRSRRDGDGGSFAGERIGARVGSHLVGRRAIRALPGGGCRAHLVLLRTAPESLWMLPGLWQVMFSLGVFASCRLLPRATFRRGRTLPRGRRVSLSLARGEAAFSPWAMALPFGVGQLFAAAVLYRTLECHDDAE